MPRLKPGIIYTASRQHTLLPLLLRATRDLQSARNELRWLREHVEASYKGSTANRYASSKSVLRTLCLRRASGYPLQYILGTEYFGDLEIDCEPGVFIPRQDTAASVTFLLQRLRDILEHNDSSNLRVLDLCAGTGCMSLLFAHEYLRRTQNTTLECLGIDISAQAVRLGNKNALKHGLSHVCAYRQGDVASISSNMTSHPPILEDRRWDILISNPPYISHRSMRDSTEKSVKRHEPMTALMPTMADPAHYEYGTAFYPRLIHIAKTTRASIILFEVADMEQAIRVADMILCTPEWDVCEIWRDQPTIASSETLDINGQEVSVRGQGHGRSVIAWKSTVGEVERPHRKGI